jgi:hypothetical protein
MVFKNESPAAARDTTRRLKAVEFQCRSIAPELEFLVGERAAVEGGANSVLGSERVLG